MSTEFNEMTRVQFPAILHLMGLGYDFISKKKVEKIKDPKNKADCKIKLNTSFKY